ncbi:MAG TPA: metallophosphoesterase [Thermoanaerobaculia bacterium]
MTLLHTLSTTSAQRLFFIGDVHGCYDELVELLARLAPAAHDVVVAVGDMVTKGPAAARCLDLWRERRYLAVKGNNEIKLLARARPILRWLEREDRDVLRRGDLLRYLRSWPLVIDFPDAGATAVHGGFLPDMRITPEDIARHQDLVSQLRWIRKKKEGWAAVPKEKKKRGDVLWAEQWGGERMVVYGHTPLREPRFDRLALGLDTGCVYGGKLTAGILTDGNWELVSVAAKRKYAE